MRDVLVPELVWPLHLSDRQLFLDKVEITITGLRVEGSSSQCMSVLGRLHELQVPVTGGRRTRLFNRPHRRFVRHPLTAKIRTSASDDSGSETPPVFGGRLVAREGRLPTHQYAGSQECVNISLELKLNVPRFIASQTFRRSPSARRQTAVRPFALGGSRGIVVEGDEVSFGCDGNVLMGGRELYSYAASKSPVSHLNDLLGAIVSEITVWLEERLDLNVNMVRSSPSFTLAGAEWYSEFRANDPRRQVTSMMPVLSRRGRLGNIFRRRLTGQVRTFGPHSYAMQIELANGIKQTTYSKTNRRIRFEVKFYRRYLSRIIGRRYRLSAQQLSEALHKLRQRTRRELHRLFDALSAGLEPANEGWSLEALLYQLAQRCQNSYCYEEIARSLRDTGRVVVENRSFLRPSIDALICRSV